MFTFYYANLILLIILMIPSVIYQAKKEEEEKENKEKRPEYHNKALEMAEKAGRYGTMFFYVVRLESEKHFSALSYLIQTAFLILYIALWIVLWKRPGMKRSVLLSVIPSLLFLSSAVIDNNWLMLAFALIFAPAHIAVSIKSAAFDKNRSYS